jgi:DNA-binding IclR family transcriptional regulator
LREESKHPLRVGIHVGSSLPAYASGLGKALLSELSQEEIDGLFPQELLKPVTAKTVSVRGHLKKQLEEVKKSGVAVVREEAYVGADAVASVIRDAGGRAVASMAISVPTARSSEERLAQFAQLIKRGASLVSYRLGYQEDPSPVRDLEELRRWWDQNQVLSASRRMKKNLKMLRGNHRAMDP